MSARTIISAADFVAKPLDIFSSGWFILSTGSFASGKFNGMTVSWGAAGTLWGKPFAMVLVRPQRHTLKFINTCDSFTLSAFAPEYRKTLNFFGSKSGAECDKFKETGLTPEASLKVSAPSIKEAELVIECRKTYCDWLKPEHFLDKEAIEKWYPARDFHKFFFGEILAVSGTEKYRIS